MDPTDIINIHEHFLDFISVESSTGSVLTECIVRKLSDMNIPIANMHNQDYDNGSNMKGV